MLYLIFKDKLSAYCSLALPLALLICLNLTANAVQPLHEDNVRFGILLTHTLPSGITSSMSLDEITKHKSEFDEVRLALIKSLKQTILPMIRVATPTMNSEGTNIKNEVLKSVALLSDALKKNLAEIKLTDKMIFQIMLVPTFTPRMKAKRLSGEEVQLKYLYSTDKFAIFEPMANLNQTSSNYLNSEVLDSALRLLNDHASNEEKKLQPALITVSMNLILDPNVNNSKISVQAVIGMPLGKKIDFTQNTDQINLTGLTLPDPGINTNLTDTAKSDQPCAFVHFVLPFDVKKDVVMHITFGPIGVFNGEYWVSRTATDKSTAINFVPELIGNPKFKNHQIPALEVGFRLTSLSFNITEMQVQDMDLYLAIKTPFFTVGNFNKPDIDGQFVGEINKAIKEQIANIPTQAADKATAQVPIPAPVIKALMEKLFQK